MPAAALISRQRSTSRPHRSETGTDRPNALIGQPYRSGGHADQAATPIEPRC